MQSSMCTAQITQNISCLHSQISYVVLSRSQPQLCISLADSTGKEEGKRPSLTSGCLGVSTTPISTSPRLELVFHSLLTPLQHRISILFRNDVLVDFSVTVGKKATT